MENVEKAEAKTADQSHLDRKYFIDEEVYNCPFCNRRHVKYALAGRIGFDWNNGKRCYVFFAECFSCRKLSMHLSFSNIATTNYYQSNYFKFDMLDIAIANKELDDLFFFSVPKSFFILDDRIPKILRELFSEAEGCLKSNFLTGASACARKVVYELGGIQRASGNNYEERIKSLKAINSGLDPTYFDTLLTIQQVTSDKVHEESYDGWESKHLRLILSTLSEVLFEIFVNPKVREEKRKAILKLKDEVLGSKKDAVATTAVPAAKAVQHRRAN